MRANEEGHDGYPSGGSLPWLHGNMKSFISYVKGDAAWAEWIARVLEENSDRTVVQEWDPLNGPGVIKVGHDVNEAEETVVVWSHAYGQTGYLRANGLSADNKNRRLFVLQVEDCNPPSFHEDFREDLHRADLFGIGEAAARQKLTKLIRGSLEPREKLPFPGKKRRVFIVHGHDYEALKKVNEFVLKAGYVPVILQTEADRGQTIIEKFEVHSETVDFAVVLLTPDDEGRKLSPLTELRLRARQNVIAELFFFIGKLGRKRVCALTKDKIEVPSDIGGVSIRQMEDCGSEKDENWEIYLAREMRAADLPIDFDNRT